MAKDDFDFFHGSWAVKNRRLTADGWTEFPAECVVRGLVGQIGFVDEMTFPTLDTGGSTIGLYDSTRDRWAHYWVSTRDGVLQPPVYGAGVGDYFGDDELDGKPIRVRYRWTVQSRDAFVWEQAFSLDVAATSWETNWLMEFSRVAD